jgi:hypothetical protein
MAITNGYCTLAEMKAALRIATDDTTDDSLLELSVESASREIDNYCARFFYNGGTATYIYAPQRHDITYVQDLPGTAVTVSISTNADGVFDTTLTYGTDYQLEPLNGRSAGVAMPYTTIRSIGNYWFPMSHGIATVKVVGLTGWTAIPTSVKQATIITGMRLFKRLDSPLGVAGFGDMGVMRVGRGLDPDVQQLVQDFRRMESLA